MTQKPLDLKSQISQNITHLLESRNGPDTISLEITAISQYHLLAGENTYTMSLGITAITL